MLYINKKTYTPQDGNIWISEEPSNQACDPESNLGVELIQTYSQGG